MNNAPHLLAEDRPDFERLLDDALRDGTVLTALRAPGALTTAELRAQALLDADGLAAAAGTEYEHYTRLRANLRSMPAPPGPDGEPAAPGLLAQLGSANGGAGLFPVLTVLTPILAWAAALVLLLLGYTLRAADPEAALSRSILTAGWVALAAGVAAMAVGIVGLVLTAVRDGSRPSVPAGTDPELAAELGEAHREWQRALRDRALLPYLHAALRGDAGPTAAMSTAAAPGSAGAATASAAPVPGQGGRPKPDRSRARGSDSTGPDGSDTGGPDFSSPGYTGPGFSSPGVEGLTDPQGREPRTAAFTPPDFTGPGYTPPGFTGPDDV
ncbi:hypothetical protein [Kitasatospora sp. A2-31]|uniref:hypothetical protein n=1 Tax=Kitasatospora sp. A2-31 TaxID=2916414 RepID=UPI001EEAC638|nr:hypothetical protein [Kitasatospora sp. A2-31]MCG6494727.1 hypothetical protein [Kitasatospora sp. A2-31]